MPGLPQSGLNMFSPLKTTSHPQRPLRFVPRRPQDADMYLLPASVALIASFGLDAQSATLQVGPQHALTRPSEAAAIARNDDVIEIEAGEYIGDAAIWRADRLTLRGVNGMAHLRSNGVTAQGKAIWVIKGNDTLVENVGFHGARVPSRNGAGIRQEGSNLTVRNSLFRHNENGILAGTNPSSEIVIETSEFDGNGHGDGKSHNLYVGAIRSLVLRNNHIHDAHVGHQVKSRAAVTRILNNRIEDGKEGDSSYLIDLPAGGSVEITGNLLQQGRYALNTTMISYGAEKLLHDENNLIVEYNKFINLHAGNCMLLKVLKGLSKPSFVRRNTLSGCRNMQGLIETSNNREMTASGQ